MSEARPLHVDAHAADAQVIPLPQRPLRVVTDSIEGAQTAPTVAAPRGGGQRAFERFSSLHEPAREATVRAAVVLAVVVAIAGVVVALKLAGVMSIDDDVAFDRGAGSAATTRAALAAPSWRHGWGTVPRNAPAHPQR